MKISVEYNDLLDKWFYYLDVFSKGANQVAYSDALDGLCFAIEEGFDLGYIENPLRMGFSIHIPAGCAAPEADMTSFNSFEASINEYVQMLIEDYGYED